jgi:hypothetical protein
MDRAFGLILYALVYRVAIVAAGTFFMYLGYKLFDKEADRAKNAAFEGNLAGAKVSLKNAAPGVFFALFGCIVITGVVYRGSSFSFPDDGARGASVFDRLSINPSPGQLQYTCSASPLPFSNQAPVVIPTPK